MPPIGVCTIYHYGRSLSLNSLPASSSCLHSSLAHLQGASHCLHSFWVPLTLSTCHPLTPCPSYSPLSVSPSAFLGDLYLLHSIPPVPPVLLCHTAHTFSLPLALWICAFYLPIPYLSTCMPLCTSILEWSSLPRLCLSHCLLSALQLRFFVLPASYLPSLYLISYLSFWISPVNITISKT